MAPTNGKIPRPGDTFADSRWEDVTRLAAPLGVSSQEVPELYLESLGWARERVEVRG